MRIDPLTKKEPLVGDVILKKYRPLNKLLEDIYGVSHLSLPMFNKVYSLLEPKDKHILELGCGSIDYSSTRNFEPWLARALTLDGARVTGIDIGELSDEPFEHYKLDLKNPESLSIFKNSSFDLVIADSFFNSYKLSVCDNERIKIFNDLLPQLSRILKKDGFFTYDSSFDNYII
ncbi:MAG: hypothetical protein ACLFN8_01610 [Candidatus Woesearchaeota archaeon]